MDMSDSLSPSQLKRILGRIKDRTDLSDLSPVGWNQDPRTATPDELDQHGLPPKPDPTVYPERYAFWVRTFSKEFSADPVQFVEADFDYEEREVKPLAAYLRVLTPSRHESSINWSGAYITPRDGANFTEVHASWRVPMVQAPAGAAAVIGASEYRSSTWIGLDGQRRYRNSSMPQIGTSQFVRIKNGQWVPKYGVWWQWWVRDAENPPPITLPLPVDAGDEILASLIVVGQSRVQYLIANHTKGIVCRPFVEPDPTHYLLYPQHTRRLTVPGATAEWVTERPMNWNTKRIYELPDYGRTTFQHCFAVSARGLHHEERVQTLAGARLINMHGAEMQPFRSVVISVATWDGHNSVSTTYRRPPVVSSVEPPEPRLFRIGRQVRTLFRRALDQVIGPAERQQRIKRADVAPGQDVAPVAPVQPEDLP